MHRTVGMLTILIVTAGLLSARPAAGDFIIPTVQGSFNVPSGSPVFFGSEPIASFPGNPREEFRGFMEFDLSTVPLSGFVATLHLGDSGGTAAGLATTDVSSYIGDGTISVADFDPSSGTFLFEIQRPFNGGTTDHDVTSVVNAFKASNQQFLGIHLQAAAPGQDAFQGSLLEITAAVPAVPEPSTLSLVGSGIILLGWITWWRRYSNFPRAS
jgi:hypothetical protein